MINRIKLVCIDTFPKDECGNNHRCYYLTKGKVYDAITPVIRGNTKSYIIVNDNNDQSEYEDIFFDTLENIRQDKLNKVLDGN